MDKRRPSLPRLLLTVPVALGLTLAFMAAACIETYRDLRAVRAARIER